MAGFNLPFGPMDPSSLPAQLRQQMAAPGMISGPVPPVQLTSGFHPPGGGMGAMATPQAEPGFNVKDGLALLSQGLERFKSRNGQEEPRPISPADAMAAYRSMPRSFTMPGFEFVTAPAGADPNALLGNRDFLTGLPFNSSWENFRG
jgi:hypothetical protein